MDRTAWAKLVGGVLAITVTNWLFMRLGAPLGTYFVSRVLLGALLATSWSLAVDRFTKDRKR